MKHVPEKFDTNYCTSDYMMGYLAHEDWDEIEPEVISVTARLKHSTGVVYNCLKQIQAYLNPLDSERPGSCMALDISIIGILDEKVKLVGTLDELHKLYIKMVETARTNSLYGEQLKSWGLELMTYAAETEGSRLRRNRESVKSESLAMNNQCRDVVNI